MSISNVLLIDKSIKDYTVFVSSVNASTLPIVYSNTTSRAELLTQLSAYTYIDRIGIAFSNDGTNTFIENETFFGDNMNFIIQIIQQFNVKNIDYLGCDTLNTPGWKEYYASLLEQTGVIVGASNNKTGNIQYGGDWVLESTGQDIELIYFTESIKYYKYLLDFDLFKNCSFIINQDNTLYGTGDSTYGELGNGYSTYIGNLTLLPVASKTPMSIACGSIYTIVLMTDGTLYGTGFNIFGQLGLNNTTNQSSFVQIPNSSRTAKAIACGQDHTIVLMSDGTIYGAGANYNNQLGLGAPYGTKSVLTIIPNASRIATAISCGLQHTVILNSTNVISGFGSNEYGQLAQTGSSTTTALVTITNSSAKMVMALSCGYYHTVFLMTDGTIYGTGRNNYGQLGLNPTTTLYRTLTLMPNSTRSAKAIACGGHHTIVLMTNNTIYGTGANSYGQLGQGNTVNPNVLTIISNLTDKRPSSISAGGNDSFVVMSDGSIYSVGKILSDLSISNTNTLQLITNTTGKTVDSSFKIMVSLGSYEAYPYTITSTYFLLVMTDNSIYGMGYIPKFTYGLSESYHTLGLGNPLGIALSYDYLPDFPSIYTVTSFNNINVYNKIPKYVSYGGTHTTVLMTDRTIYGTGYNGYGQLGLGNTIMQNSLTLMPNTTSKRPKAIANGQYHTIVLMTDGSLYGTGRNTEGQLGINDYINRYTLTLIPCPSNKTPKSIACGFCHTIVLMTDGTLYGTGKGSEGQLGIGDFANYGTLQSMPIPNNKIASSIACGYSHTMVLMEDGTIYGTGNNSEGQLGINDLITRGILTLVIIEYDVPGINYGTPNLIACGNQHTVFITINADYDKPYVFATGRGLEGQLGSAEILGRFTPDYGIRSINVFPQSIGCGPYNTILLASGGKIYGSGSRNYGELGDPTKVFPYQAGFQEIPNTQNVNQLYNSDISIIDIPFDVSDIDSNIVCFKEGSLILTDNGYLPIQDLRAGHLVKTVLHGFVPIYMICKRDIFHHASTERIKNQLYVCTSDAYPEVFQPLVISGCHSILVPRFSSEEERQNTIKVNGNTYVTDKKYRLPACVDERAKVYDKPGIYTIYHFSLENNDYYMNYGVYANGLLVETCSKRYLKEISNMEILG